MTEEDIIEAEVLSENIVEAKAPQKPKKVASSDHSKAVDRYAKLSRLFLRLGRAPLLLFAALGFAFTILYSQSSSLVHLVFLLVFWGMAVLSVFFTVLGYIFRRMQIRHMRKDPNYDHYFR